MVKWKKFFLENDEKEHEENKNIEIAEDIEESDEDFEISGQVEDISEENKTEENKTEENENIEEDKKEIEKKEEPEGLLAKFVNLFLTPEEDKVKNRAEDKPEDYKTYFERQKKEQVAKEEIENSPELDEVKEVKEQEETSEKIDIDYSKLDLQDSYEGYEDDLFDDFEDEEILEEPKKKSIIGYFKAKLSAFTQYGLKKDDDTELLEEDKEEVSSKKESKFSKLMTKMTISKKDVEELADEDEDFDLFEELDRVEEKEFSQEKISNEAIQEKLKSMGITSNDVKDVDLFSKREVIREHPTLASVKVRRILQEHEIDNLEKDVILEENKDRFTKETFEQKQDFEIEKEEEKSEHNSKNLEEIARLNKDFNQLNRKEDKKSLAQNHLKVESDNIDSAINEIKKQEQLASTDNKDYTIVVEECDSEKERRDKLKYTSIDDILDGRDDLFETDIERAAKKIVDTRVDEEAAEEVEKFRQDVHKEKSSEDLVADKDNKTVLDELILETKLVEKKKDKEENEEIRKLEKNLEILKEENEFKAQLAAEFEEEISIEQVARESEYKFEDYDDLKQEAEEDDKLSGYSDYNLDPEEIEALTIQNKIESETENTNIETLNKEVDTERARRKISLNIDEFIKETSPAKENILISRGAKKEVKREPKKQIVDIQKINGDKEKSRKNRTKLYTEDMDLHIDGRNAIIAGEYRTRDRGYRPVSKEQIEGNIRKLDAIFEKYSHIKMPSASSKKTTDFAKLKADATASKYKPTQFVSAVHGTNIPQNTSYNLERKKRREASKYFKEIASQEETVWNIDVSSRATKVKPKARRTRRTKAKEE
ncbi:hypothetical protein [Gemella sp. zg-1178]|uniref:hypothetical protein n=1 Tax=Gemella sp. zg-1178 TaxID=2840372 RepID=UPI001C056DB2|nr:hypothetical protein [Gemella sp. zg-1178]MBU0279267.1 hypothetical protein [Gemella sp. zg-1178]